MQKLRILNKKEIKHILELIKKRWGSDAKLDYAFLMSEKNKIYIINKEFSKIDEKKLRIDSMGLYFGELSGELRLSVEGSQLVGKKASKGVAELDDEQIRNYLKGEDIDYDSDETGFFLIKHKNDFFGTGKLKNKKVLNYLPKARRIILSQSY